MTTRLRDLIKQVRACKTAAAEREVIAKESAAIRDAIRDPDLDYRHRVVAKLMYIHMLGYPTHFGQVETLKLVAGAGANFPEKRIGYLGLTILLDERQEVLMMVTNSLKYDMNHKHQFVVGIALTAMGNICSAGMARDLSPDIERLLENTNPYIRKKAALTAMRVVVKVPDLVEGYVDRAGELLHDRNPSVLLAGTALMLQLCELDAGAVENYRQHVPMLCKLLRVLLHGGGAADNEASGVTQPHLQVKILRLLRYLGKGNAEASDQMSDILAQVATSIDSSRNAGNAVLYECVQTIMGVESMGGLRVLAINILGRFLVNRDNNIRYVALNTLAKVVAVDTQAVSRHRNTVVDCVKDPDVSIRKRALELVYHLANEGNVKGLVQELLDYLIVCDAEFKPDLTEKVCTLIQRFAADRRWCIDSMATVLQQAGPYVPEEACRVLVVLITNADDMHAYSTRALWRVMTTVASPATSLVKTTLWLLGEYGDLLTKGSGPWLPGEPPLSVSEAEVLSALEGMLRRPDQDATSKEYLLTCLMKLNARLPSQAARTNAMIAAHRQSPQLEVQARSCEYVRITSQHAAICTALLEPVPALDESQYTRNLATEVKGSSSTAAAGGSDAAGASSGNQATALLDLLSVDGAAAAAPAAAAAVAAAAPAAAGGLDSLLGGLGAAPAGDLFGGLGLSTSAAAPATAFAPITAYSKAGLSISFAFAKNNQAAPGETSITATISNANAADATDFNLLAAVPKYITLALQPASSTTVPAGGAGSVSQQLTLTNAMHGAKPLAMRLKVTYAMGGAPVEDLVEVSNFPAGL